MTDNRLSVEMLPARQGDALWIEWGDEDDRHRMLIDGGLSQTFGFIRDRFEALDDNDRHVDLMVVTHIDLDHIAGSIKLLEDDDLGITYGDVWFNDYRHLGDGPIERGAMQGEVLAAVLTGYQHPWNQAFDGRAVVVPETGALPSVTLPGGLKLVLLSPSPGKLLDLKKTWEKTLSKKNLEPGEHAAEMLEEIEEELAVAERGGKKTFGGDHSSANGSSIAFIAEYRGQRWLLAGDAHEDVLADALDRYGQSIDEMPVPLDGFKVPHHGSMNNFTENLLSKIVCSRFLVSSDGSRFKHPDEECIDLIVEKTNRPELIFNYATEFNEKWRADSNAYTAVFPDSDDGGITTSAERTAGAAPIAPATDADDTEPDDDRRLQGFGGTITAHEADREEIAPLEVTVVHGSIDRAAHPVIVGHYRATPLSGAEGFLDDRMGGRLSDRLARDLYPGEIGQSLYVASPRTRHPAGGTLVVGLGEYGELTPMRLVESIRAALVRYALDCADRSDEGESLLLGISSVLVGGTGDQGLSVAGSVRAIVDAVLEANVDLRSGGADARATFGHLHLWEYNPQNAELAFRAVPTHGTAQEQGPMNSARAVQKAPELIVGEGALSTSMPVDTADAAWRRIRVAERMSGGGSDGADGVPANDGVLELDFAVTGRLARAGVVTHRVERRRLQRILRGSVGNHLVDEGIPTTLFELLFPNELKWDLMSAEHIQLEVDDLTADIPWEMLAARNPREDKRGALALRAPLVRQLRLEDPPSVRRASRASALVIGNPPVGHLAAPLAGAFQEGKAVANLLGKRRHGYDVREAIYEPTENASDEATLAIEKALFERDYRIVHVAAHGFFNPDDSTRSGIAIGPDSFLTADMIGQLNVVPDVVFLNCCHLGAITVGRDNGSIDFTRRRHNELGASLARRLIERGVRAVVVAGWAVADQAAEDFAIRFYEEMLDGSTFGDAVHKARLAARIRQPKHSTWGAYQCYGDGGYKLPIRRRDDGTPRPPSTVREALHRLERLVSQLESVGTADRHAWFVDEIESIEHAAAARRWFTKTGNGALREQLGEAWATLGDFEAAIGHYDAGMQAEDAAISLRALERLANLHDRRAGELRRRGGEDADRAEIEHHLDESDRLMSILRQIGPTGERLALDAGRMKRRAVAMQGEQRLSALSDAAHRYKESYGGTEQPYTILNYLQLEEIRARIAGDEPETASWQTPLDESLRDHEPSPDGDYWADVRRPDAHLTQSIANDSVDRDFAILEELYRAVFDNRSRASERASTLNHLLDLADLHPDEQQSGALRRLHDSLANAEPSE